jgi:hypothetical protein
MKKHRLSRFVSFSQLAFRLSPNGTRSAGIVLLRALIAACLVGLVSALGLTWAIRLWAGCDYDNPPPYLPYVCTEYDDYPPGSTVFISGAGFHTNELVQLQVYHAEGEQPTDFGHQPWTTTADADGNFLTSWYVEDDCAGQMLYLIAVGQTSELTATVFFSDAPRVCVANPGTVDVDPPSGGFGIDGDLQANTPVTGVGDWVSGPSGAGGAIIDSSAGDPLDAYKSATSKLQDEFDSSVDDNFAGGLKVDDNPNSWTWVCNPVNDKQDVHRAYVFRTVAPDTGHQWLVVSGDRRSNNGDSYIDFEFLQNSLARTGACPDGGGFVSQ